MKLCQITKKLKTNIIFLDLPVGPTQTHGYNRKANVYAISTGFIYKITLKEVF